MALQGTIETFALPDVLRLLSSTKKTGQLRLDGNRGSGSLWVDEGLVVAGEAGDSPTVTDPGEVLFELLRFENGDFVFEDDQTPSEKGEPAEVEPLLASAEEMLEEWKAIEAVVPSLAHHVNLVPELDGDEVVVTAQDWKTLVAIGGGTSVAGLGDELGLGELSVSRAVKQLAEQGMVEVGEPRAEQASWSSRSAEVDEPAVEAGPDDAVSTESEPEAAGGFESFDPSALVIDDEPITSFEDEVASPVGAEPDATDAAEIARQLANLSPKAAKAVAAAAKATTPEEREAALAEVDDDEDPINRELLIKFLGSVNS